MRRALALGAFFLLGGCAREDEDLQRQLVEMRETLAAKSKALEQAESQRISQPLPTPAQTTGISTDELARAKSRIADLESQLAEAKQHASAAPASSKRDFDGLKDKLESDLTSKAKILRELLLKQAGVTQIDEIGIRNIEYPPEIIAPFRSAITFTLAASDGRKLRLVFPVTTDYDGSWSLPGPDKVQQAIKQVKDNAPAEPSGASAPTGTQLSSGGSIPRNPTGSAKTNPAGFQQVDTNTFQFDWGDRSKGGAKPRQNSPEPTVPTVSAQPSPAPPAKPEVTAPKPIMPVQRDIIIKF